LVVGERDGEWTPARTREIAMKKMRGLALLSLLALAACGGDDNQPTAPVVPPTPITNYSGTYPEQPALAGRLRAGERRLALAVLLPGNDDAGPGRHHQRRTAPITGFGVVTAPCPSLTFELAGTVAADGTITFSADGPRPLGCPSKKATYSGLFAGRQLSARGSTSIECSGETEGTHRFDYVITAFKNN
jgi:hypothetical protein